MYSVFESCQENGFWKFLSEGKNTVYKYVRQWIETKLTVVIVS